MGYNYKTPEYQQIQARIAQKLVNKLTKLELDEVNRELLRIAEVAYKSGVKYAIQDRDHRKDLLEMVKASVVAISTDLPPEKRAIETFKLAQALLNQFDVLTARMDAEAARRK